MFNSCQTCWNFPPVGAVQRSHINAVGSRSSAGTRILDWRLVRNKRTCNLVAHLPQSSERRVISNDDLLSPNFYRRQKKSKKKKHKHSHRRAARRINSNVECQQIQPAHLAGCFNFVCKFAQERPTGSVEEIAPAVHFLSSCLAPGGCARLLMEHSKG